MACATGLVRFLMVPHDADRVVVTQIRADQHIGINGLDIGRSRGSAEGVDRNRTVVAGKTES